MQRNGLTPVLMLLTAVSFIAMTAASASAEGPVVECLEIAGKAGEKGNFEAGCKTLRANGAWVKVIRVAERRAGQWCAEVEAGKEAGIVGYADLLECFGLPRAAMANAIWVKVIYDGAVGKGGAQAPSFKLLPTVKTFKGMGGPNTLKAGASATSCEEAVDAGEITGMPTIGKLVVTFTGCHVNGEGGKTCTIKSVGAKEGDIVTHTLKGELGTTKSTEATSEVGLLLEPETTKTWATLEATTCSSESKVTGSLAAEVLPISEKTDFGSLNFAVSSGKQNIKKIAVSSAVKEPELVAFSTTATEELEDGIEFNGQVEIV
jgi:hypothetical protein